LEAHARRLDETPDKPYVFAFVSYNHDFLKQLHLTKGQLAGMRGSRVDNIVHYFTVV